MKIEYAYDKDKNLVSVIDSTKKELYTCINCGAKIIVKQGEKVIKYLAHPPYQACTPELIYQKAQKLIKENLIKKGINLNYNKFFSPKIGIDFNEIEKIDDFIIDNSSTNLESNQQDDFIWLNRSYYYATCKTENYNLHIEAIFDPYFPPPKFYTGVWNKFLNQEVKLGWFEDRAFAQSSCEDYVKKDYAERQRVGV